MPRTWFDLDDAASTGRPLARASTAGRSSTTPRPCRATAPGPVRGRSDASPGARQRTPATPRSGTSRGTGAWPGPSGWACGRQSTARSISSRSSSGGQVVAGSGSPRAATGARRAAAAACAPAPSCRTRRSRRRDDLRDRATAGGSTLLGLVQVAEDPLAHLPDVLAVVGERQAPALPLDERPAQPVFELANGMADRRLGDVQASGRRRCSCRTRGGLEEDLEPARCRAGPAGAHVAHLQRHERFHITSENKSLLSSCARPVSSGAGWSASREVVRDVVVRRASWRPCAPPWRRASAPRAASRRGRRRDPLGDWQQRLGQVRVRAPARAGGRRRGGRPAGRRVWRRSATRWRPGWPTSRRPGSDAPPGSTAPGPASTVEELAAEIGRLRAVLSRIAAALQGGGDPGAFYLGRVDVTVTAERPSRRRPR